MNILSDIDFFIKGHPKTFVAMISFIIVIIGVTVSQAIDKMGENKKYDVGDNWDKIKIGFLIVFMILILTDENKMYKLKWTTGIAILTILIYCFLYKIDQFKKETVLSLGKDGKEEFTAVFSVFVSIIGLHLLFLIYRNWGDMEAMKNFVILFLCIVLYFSVEYIVFMIDKSKHFHIHHWTIGIALALLHVPFKNTSSFVFIGIGIAVFLQGLSVYGMATTFEGEKE